MWSVAEDAVSTRPQERKCVPKIFNKDKNLMSYGEVRARISIASSL